jgi:hypothetical protein
MGNNGDHTQDYYYEYEPLSIQELNELPTDQIQLIGQSVGIDWSQLRHQNAIAKREVAARKLTPVKTSEQIKTTLRFIAGAGNVVLMLVMYLFIYVAMPLAIPAFAAVEYTRVRQGVEMFDPGIGATLSSFVIVTGLTGLMVVAAHTGAHGDHKKPSLRISAKQVLYWVGFGPKWRAKKETESDALLNTIKSVVRLVIFLGIIGPLSDEIALKSVGVAWYTGIKRVLLDSELLIMLELIGGASLTAVAAGMLHYLVDYNYAIFRKAVESADFLSNDSLAEEQKRQYMIMQVAKATQDQESQS